MVCSAEVEFLIHDDQSDTTLAPALYEKLISEEQIDAVLGPYGSALTKAVAPVVEKHRKVMLSPDRFATSKPRFPTPPWGQR